MGDIFLCVQEIRCTCRLKRTGNQTYEWSQAKKDKKSDVGMVTG